MKNLTVPKRLTQNFTRGFFLFVLGCSVLFYSASCSVDGAKKTYILAEKLWEDRKYAAAVNEFDKVTRKDPQSKLGLQALYRSAMTETIFLKKHKEAIQKFRKFAETSGDAQATWSAQIQIGDILYSKLKNYSAAISHYNGLVKSNAEAREIPQFMFRVAKSHFFLWEFKKAISSYEKLIKRFSESDWAERAAFEIGVTYFTIGESLEQEDQSKKQQTTYQKAIQSYKTFMAQYPKSRLVNEARFGMANCFEEIDQLESAYKIYEALKETYASPRVIEIKLHRLRERLKVRSGK